MAGEIELRFTIQINLITFVFVQIEIKTNSNLDFRKGVERAFIYFFNLRGVI